MDAIPTTLAGSLMARLDRLSTAKEVAQRAAVLGREFGSPLLAAVAEKEDAGLRQGLARLVDAEFVFQRGEPPEATYTFTHALVQEAAYESLQRGRALAAEVFAAGEARCNREHALLAHATIAVPEHFRGKAGEIGYRLIRPRFCERRAELARQRGDTAETEGPLHEARRLYQEMGAPLQLERLDRADPCWNRPSGL